MVETGVFVFAPEIASIAIVLLALVVFGAEQTAALLTEQRACPGIQRPQLCAIS